MELDSGAWLGRIRIRRLERGQLSGSFGRQAVSPLFVLDGSLLSVGTRERHASSSFSSDGFDRFCGRPRGDADVVVALACCVSLSLRVVFCVVIIVTGSCRDHVAMDGLFFTAECACMAILLYALLSWL